MELRSATVPRGQLGGRAVAAPIAHIRARLRVPLYRNGYALVASSGLTSALGLVYWLVAAREYSVTAVGVSAALISAMTLLANVSQLNLKGALNRFLPRAGARSSTIVVRCYLIALGATLVSSGVFLAGLGVWAPDLAFLLERPELALWFVAATLAWTIFVLQDSVLAGIRQATWVPVENLAFALAKIVLLVALAATAPMLGAFLSWSAPALLLIVPVNLLLFRRLLPRHVRATQGREQRFPAWRIASYVAADYAAYAIWSGTIGVLPLVVLGVAGAEANAYFYVSWSIAYSLYLVSSGMSMSLLAEASLDPGRLGEHTRRTIVESARIVAPAVAAVVVLAPHLLGLLGEDYSGEAATLLRLLALSALPFVIVAAYASAARAERRMRRVVGTYAGLCGLVFALGIPLLVSVGIVGLGIAWLGAQTAVAAVLVADRLARPLAARCRAGLVRALGRGRVLLRSGGRKLATANALHAVLDTLALHRSEWRGLEPLRRMRVVNDVAVSLVGPPWGEPVAVVKQALTEPAEAALRRQEQALLALRGEPSLDGVRALVPEPLAGGRVKGRAFLAESALPGAPAEALLGGQLPVERFLAATEEAIRPLHAAAAERVSVGEELLREWIDLPIERLRRAAARRSGLARWQRALHTLRWHLRQELAGAEVTTGWVHGDLCPGNVLVSPDGAVTGVVDWEHAGSRELPQLDLLHLLLTTRSLTERRELGAVVAGLLGGRLGRSRSRWSGSWTRALLLLAWLRHLDGNLTKSERYERSRAWVRGNLDPVLAAVLKLPMPIGMPAPGATRPARKPRPRGLRALAAAASSRAAAVPRIGAALAAGALAIALAAWVPSLRAIDPRAMSDLGLISVLPAGFLAALAALTAGFLALVSRPAERPRLLTAHLVALIVVLHATPAIVYGTLRYSWAWKHLGVVDYIERHGGVATGIDYLGIYHNWPGFFGLDALLARLAGLPDLIDLASWAPVFFNLLNLAALVFLFSGLTRDRRVVWLASWLFFVASWVGQDYFAPQAFAFFLYVVLLGVVVRWLPRKRGWAAALSLVLVVAIAVSHPLTSVMAVIALTGLVLSGVCAVRSLPVAAGAITLAWDLLFASNFVERHADSTVDAIRLPWTTTESSLAATEQLSQGQQLVATMSRGLVVAMLLLAAVGAVRQLRARRLNRAAAVLAAAPVVLFASGDYGGEILFRIYLFALPFLAFFAAHAFLPRPRARGLGRPGALAFGATAAVLLGMFLFAYYGKERQYYFTPGEVEAAEYLYTHAPPGSLLIEGTRNYPGQFKNYERFDYVPLSREPASSHARFVARPAAIFSNWMSQPGYSAAYLVITRGQKAEVDELGVLPRRSLDRIEQELLASSRFKPVFRNRDATVLTLARPPRRAAR